MAGISKYRVLNSDQTEAFDTEYVHDGLWSIIRTHIDNDFPDGEFKFVDLGGGNGIFADRVLNQYPASMGIVIDRSEILIAKNREHPRKTTICDSIENLSDHSECNESDLVFLNWVLHHLVSSTRSESISNISHTLSQVSRLLNDRGRLSVFENMYDGLILDELPSKIIFALTSNIKYAHIIRRLGANTAGCGVCMLSHRIWNRMFDETGLQILDYTDDHDRKVAFLRRLLLHLRRMRVGHYWVK